MKINFEMTGGFAPVPALHKPVILDTGKIAPEIANELTSLVRKSDFFHQPLQTGNIAKGAADYRTYTITVDEDSLVHTIQLTDPITDANLRQLVTLLQSLAR